MFLVWGQVLFQPIAISEQIRLNTASQVLWNSLHKLCSNTFLSFAKFIEMVEQLVNYSEIDESLLQFIGTKALYIVCRILYSLAKYPKLFVNLADI